MDAPLRNLSFLKTLSEKSRAEVLQGASVRKARKNQILVQQGEVLSHVFLLIEGTLRIYTATSEGREATLYLLRDGEVCLLSLNSAFSNARYPACVSVESGTASIALLPSRVVRTLFTHEAGVQEMVLESLTTAVKELFAHLDDVLTCRLLERIERFLLRNCDLRGRINITHQELANHLGVAREAVSREIGVLRRRKRLTSGRGFFQLTAAKTSAAAV